MSLEQVLLSLQETALGRFLDEGRYLPMLVQALHILAFTLLLAVVLVLALRVQGWALSALPLNRLASSLQRTYRWALGVALVAGFLLFLPQADFYGLKPVFQWKLLILLVAVAVHALVQRGVSNLPADRAASAPLKSLALLSLLLWVTTAVAGRAIGFV